MDHIHRPHSALKSGMNGSIFITTSIAQLLPLLPIFTKSYRLLYKQLYKQDRLVFIHTEYKIYRQ